jgi:hypothetical protein
MPIQDITRASKVLDHVGSEIDGKDWDMFQVEGGWIVPKDAFYREELYDESKGDEDAFYEKQADEASKFEEDDDGNRFTKEHAMFHMNRPDKVIDGANTGNEGA